VESARREHWHGATEDYMMSHCALLEDDGKGGATWLEPSSQATRELNPI
jgi:hypothetical protein